MTSSASKPSDVTTGIWSASSTSRIRLTCPWNALGRLAAVGLVVGIGVVAERVPSHVERHCQVRGRLVAQGVDEHRGEPVDRVGRLPGGGREVLDREREEGAVGDRVAVEQQEPRTGGGGGLGAHVVEPSQRCHASTVASVTDNLTFTLPDGSPDYAAINSSSPLLLRMGIVLTEATPDRLGGHDAGGGQHPAVRPAARRSIGGPRGDARLVRRDVRRRARAGGGRRGHQRHPPSGRPVGQRHRVATPIHRGDGDDLGGRDLGRHRRPRVHLPDHLPAARGRPAPDAGPAG